jgi:hypothetical protein
VFLVSTLPWAASVALPRFSAGIGWLLLAVTLATTFSSGVIGTWTASSSGLEELAWSAWSFFVYPIGAIGHPLVKTQFLAAIPALVLAVCAMVIACRWIAERDVPLEAAQ